MRRFDHHRLDAYVIAREALGLGEAVAGRLPRGHAHLADQLRRSLLAAFLGIAEGSSRTGADRLARFRCARGEASEAAAALEAVAILGLATEAELDPVLDLLDRLCAMLTRLARLAPQAPPDGPADPRRGRPPPSNTNTNLNTVTDSETDSEPGPGP
jgi:four helix bundle protein